MGQIFAKLKTMLNEAFKDQQPPIFYGVNAGITYCDEHSLLSEYESPGYHFYEKVFSVHLTKNDAEKARSRLENFIEFAKGKVDPEWIYVQLDYAEVIEIEIGKSILGDDLDKLKELFDKFYSKPVVQQQP